MSKKLYGLITNLIDAAAIAAVALVAFFQPAMYGAIIAAIGIAKVAINDILLLFVDDKEAKK
jgi:hypothetical protein